MFLKKQIPTTCVPLHSVSFPWELCRGRLATGTGKRHNFRLDFPYLLKCVFGYIQSMKFCMCSGIPFSPFSEIVVAMFWLDNY